MHDHGPGHRGARARGPLSSATVRRRIRRVFKGHGPGDCGSVVSLTPLVLSKLSSGRTDGRMDGRTAAPPAFRPHRSRAHRAHRIPEGTVALASFAASLFHGPRRGSVPEPRSDEQGSTGPPACVSPWAAFPRIATSRPLRCGAHVLHLRAVKRTAVKAAATQRQWPRQQPAIHLSLPPIGPFVSLPPSLHARTHTCFPTFHASVLIQAPCQALGTKRCKGARGKAVMTTQYGKCHGGHTDRGPAERVRVRGPAHLKMFDL